MLNRICPSAFVAVRAAPFKFADCARSPLSPPRPQVLSALSRLLLTACKWAKLQSYSRCLCFVRLRGRVNSSKTLGGLSQEGYHNHKLGKLMLMKRIKLIYVRRESVNNCCARIYLYYRTFYDAEKNGNTWNIHKLYSPSPLLVKSNVQFYSRRIWIIRVIF